jgi:predicted dehydrogenase
MKSLNRRSFIKSTALTAAAFSLPARSWSQIEGSNSDVRVAVVGFGQRGQSHINGFSKLSGVRITALCDVDAKILDREVDRFKKQGKEVERHVDVRKLLESKNIDVVSIATPNHWHALAGIWSIQSGKDVYVEKPVSHNVWEGRKFVEAARKYKRIVQTGTQSRSSRKGIQAAVDWVKEGNLGKIVIARGLCYKPRGSIGKTMGPQPIPGTVEYDLWCGPAPLDPPRRNTPKFGTIHYDWHWFWAYGSGDLGNQGIHQMDICRWFLGEMELAPSVVSVGGRLGYEDDAETPNTQLVFQGYQKAPLIFEVRGLPESKDAKNMDKYKGASVGCVIECEGGYVTVPNYSSAIAYDKDGKELKKWSGAEDHFANFIKAVHSRRVEDLHADILEGHLSSALCHTGNISYRLGAKKSPQEIQSALKDTPGMTESFDRMAAHLGRNGVDIAKDKLTLGVSLKMNPKTEKFIANKDADELLTRKYRAPYVVPENV